MKSSRIIPRGQTTIPCKVRLKLFTLDDALILRKADALPERDAEAVKRSLARLRRAGGLYGENVSRIPVGALPCYDTLYVESRPSTSREQ